MRGRSNESERRESELAPIFDSPNLRQRPLTPPSPRKPGEGVKRRAQPT